MSKQLTNVDEVLRYAVADVEVATDLVALTKERLNHAYVMGYTDMYVELENKFAAQCKSLEEANAYLLGRVKTVLASHSVTFSSK